jgi:hypothetical protein
MKRTYLAVITLAVLMTLAFIATCRSFDTKFANSTIDWFSFLAGTFLVTESVYKMRKFRSPFFPNQLSRGVRIIIGTDIFAIHLIQFIWGVDCRALEAPLTQVAIDWSAFSFGIFLIVEGIWSIFRSRAPILRDQVLRTIRVVIGMCVLTIHILQFMRY